jgi:hypothetical protein
VAERLAHEEVDCVRHELHPRNAQHQECQRLRQRRIRPRRLDGSSEQHFLLSVGQAVHALGAWELDTGTSLFFDHRVLRRSAGSERRASTAG